MNRIDRLNAILIYLQGKPRVTLDELEARYGLTRRTLFRDIRALLDAGVPIGGDAGSGYFVVEGYHLPPVVFNKEEASAILIGAKLLEHNADAQINSSFQQALTKVKAVLRYADKEFLDQIDQRIAILPGPSLGSEGFPDSHLAEIQYSIATKKMVEMEYYSNYRDQTTERRVEPLGLVHYADRWHVVGFCHLRNELRDFRTDRIEKLRMLNEQFDPDRHPHYLDFLSDSLRGTDAREVIVRFKKEVARYISDRKYYYGYIDQETIGNEIRMRFYTPSFHFFARWLMTYGQYVTVEQPDELMVVLEKMAEETYAHHKSLREKNFETR